MHPGGDGALLEEAGVVHDQNTVRLPELDDVVSLLMRQHGDIRNLFDEVEASKGAELQDAFHRLVRLLAVHETAEEEIVHPFARTYMPGGEQIVDDRLAEGREAKEVLVVLDDLNTNDPKFMPQFLALRTKVQMHARAEERYEFTHIRQDQTPPASRPWPRASRPPRPWPRRGPTPESSPPPQTWHSAP